MNRFIQNDGSQFPHVRLCNFDKCARLSILISSNGDSPKWEHVNRAHARFEFGVRRKVEPLPSFNPRILSKSSRACLLLECVTLGQKTNSVRNSQTLLRTEARSVDLIRLEVKRLSALLARFLHEGILSHDLAVQPKDQSMLVDELPPAETVIDDYEASYEQGGAE